MDPDDVSIEPVNSGDDTDVTYLSLNKPMWVYGLRNASWLLPPHDPRAKQIAFIPLACPAARAGPQPEDDRGRFARSVALFLSESFWFQSGLRPLAMIPAIKGTGPSMSDHEMTAEEVNDLSNSGISYCVTGTLAEDGLATELSLNVWDTYNSKVLTAVTRTGPRYNLGAMMLELDGELRQQFASVAAPLCDWYVPPGPETIDGYLGCLSRSLSIFMVERQVVPKEQLVGGPNLLQWMADYAWACSELPVPPVLLTAALAADRNMGSDAYLGFRDLALAMAAREQDPKRPFYRVAPLLFQLFGDEQGYADRCGELLESGDAALLDWLAALEEQPR